MNIYGREYLPETTVAQINQPRVKSTCCLKLALWSSILSVGVFSALSEGAAFAKAPVSLSQNRTVNAENSEYPNQLGNPEFVIAPALQELPVTNNLRLQQVDWNSFKDDADLVDELRLSNDRLSSLITNSKSDEAVRELFGSTLSTSFPVAQNAPSSQPVSLPLTKPDAKIRRQGSEILGKPSVQLQGVYVLQGNESSARGRVNALYPVSPTALFGAVVDLTTGDAFSDSPGPGLRLNELYFAYAPFYQQPGLRFVVGLMDLTSYFDRNSFAKDGASQFFNQAFQTNPALSAAGLSSRPGLLMNWSISDNVEIKATGFSSRRNLGSFALDSFAAEAGFRTGNLILRGTFITSRDSGQNTGFEEIYSILRTGGFGIFPGDRENAFGLNGEYYIPKLNLGFFARYGWYNNVSLGEGGNTYSFGVTRLDLFMRNDRLGVAYGRQLSNNDLRQNSGAKIPDVLEVYYDFPVAKFLRVGVTFQELNQFSETIVGFRVKTEFNVLGRLFE